MTTDVALREIREQVSKSGRITAYVIDLYRMTALTKEQFCLAIDQGLEQFRQKACESCGAERKEE